MIEPPPTAKRRCYLGSRHRLSIGRANAACTSGHAYAFHECLVEEMARVPRRPEPDLAPCPAVRWPDNTSFLWKGHGGSVDRIAELITDIGYHLGSADEPIRFTENLGCLLGDLNDIRRRPVQSTPERPATLLTPRCRIGPPQVLCVRDNDGAVGELNLVTGPAVHDWGSPGHQAWLAVLVKNPVAYLDFTHGRPAARGRNRCVESERLARSGTATDEQMRHLCEVGDDRGALDVLAQAHHHRMVVGQRGG